MAYIFILAMVIVLVGIPIDGMLISDRKTKTHCEKWVREMKLLRDDDYRKALNALNREFPGVKER